MASILVIDDDPNARLLVTTLLAHGGHETFEAPDARIGLALACDIEPDLVIVDLSMPVMSGTDFVRALRADARTRTVGVALYTASVVDRATRDFMEIYGIVAALPKPSDPRELLAAIEAALERHRQLRISGKSSP